MTVAYSRPSVKGRAIWGTLVPYGYNKQGFGAGNDAPWRAGANENTVIRLSHPASIEGHPVPAGEYGLFFVITTQSDSLMREAVAIGTENELNNFGYQLLNDKLYDRAIEVFVLNTQRHPKSANTFDSLGEAYATKGDKKNAIVNFKHSLSLNPPDATRQNSEKYLKQLGAL